MAKDIPSELKKLPIEEAIKECLQVGEGLTFYRSLNNKRQSALARELNITRSAMGYWEHGKREPPSVIVLAVRIWLEKYRRYLESWQ